MTTFDVPISKMLVDGGYWVCRDPIWVVWDPYGAKTRDIWAKMCSFMAPGAQNFWQNGPDTRAKCVVTMSPAQAGQSGAVGTESGPPGPSEDLRGPRKNLLWPKRAPFACFTRSKCVVNISPTQAGQWGQLGQNQAPRGPPRTSEVPKRGILGQNGPF